MRPIPWETVEPGHCEVDLVHHAGGSTAGEYGHTLQLIDVATGWSERVAVLGRLPFPIRELQPDNGSEFFKTHLVRFFGEPITGLTLSRSRPYHKNDNRFVEQKNATLVRAYLGHLSLETAEQVAQLNALYEQMWIYYNLFQPVLHLAEKRRVEGKLRRIWDQAQTPFQRLLATGVLDPTPAQQLAQCYEQPNPRRLRQEICRQLAGLGRTVSPRSRRPKPWQPKGGTASAPVTFPNEGIAFGFWALGNIWI
jgi:hypothetical protein